MKRALPMRCEAKSIAGEALRLAKLTGDPVLIAEAERTVAMLPTP
jgi:hypothetical protein